MPKRKIKLPLEVLDAVDLDSFRLQETYSGEISLIPEDGTVPGMGNGVVLSSSDEKDLLSNIIKTLNETYGINITDEDKKNYSTAKQNLINKYKKLGSDIRRSYRPISQGGGGENRYTKRIKAANRPVYNSETGLNLFKNK